MANPKRSFSTFLFLALLLTGFLISGCGGGGSTDSGGLTDGGGSPGETLPAKMLSWEPPVSYVDSTPLNPVTDLDSFEVYVNESGSFNSVDSPVAYVSAVDTKTGQLNTSFDLSNLGSFLGRGVSYYVSLRAVARNGDKSAFSSTASFSF